MSKILICEKCDKWQQHPVYKYEGVCGNHPSHVTRGIHVCQIDIFEWWDQLIVSDKLYKDIEEYP